ncbi:transmembrane protein 216 [Argonauta hians]
MAVDTLSNQPVMGSNPYQGYNSIRSSLPYQILLYLNQWYFIFYFCLEVLVFIVKYNSLPYSPGVFTLEIMLVVVFVIVEQLRIFFGKKGNLTEVMFGVALSIFLSVPSLCIVLYITLWQSYVLQLEVVISSIEITFLTGEFIFGLLFLITFARSAPY